MTVRSTDGKDPGKNGPREGVFSCGAWLVEMLTGQLLGTESSQRKDFP